MIQILVTAPASGSGKTLVSCALLRLLARRGFSPCALKCGPDYIDPMFHRAALGLESWNLDLFLSGPDALRAHYARRCAGHGAAVCEGAMGYYDGAGLGTDRASAWQIADTLGLPALLVLPASGAALTLAAQVRGLRDFRTPNCLRAVLLNRCSPALCERLTPVLERESGLAVLGCLPRLEALELPRRHLGLLTAGEIAGLEEKLDVLAECFEASVDVQRLLRLFDLPAPQPSQEPEAEAEGGVCLAVARDEAFCFLYEENLAVLRACGARLVFFSPLREGNLPPGCAGLYLPGGYPELYAQALEENIPLRRAVAAALADGLPCVAECGGFLYLGERLRGADGVMREMVGTLPGQAADAGRLVRFGYGTLCAPEDSLLFRRGERVAFHEFHRWESTEPGAALHAEKEGRRWTFGYTSGSLYAGFPHLYFAGRPELAARFVGAAARYRLRKEEERL